MPLEQYVQHDWSPTSWALLMVVVILAVVAVIGLFLVMLTRACATTAPRPTGAAVAEVDALSEVTPPAAQRVPVGAGG